MSLSLWPVNSMSVGTEPLLVEPKGVYEIVPIRLPELSDITDVPPRLS